MRTIDGNLSDWTSADLLTTTGVPAGYQLYGDLSGGYLTFAMKAPTALTTGSTIWLNTDKSTATGYNIWGLFPGYDYNINFTNGVPYLYTGADGQNLVSPTPLAYAYSADHTTVEVTVPVAQIGNTTALNVLADVDNNTYLPGDYSAGPYALADKSTLPARTYTGHKIGIVYSETSASKYFSATAYSQLFMTAQDQAAQAGVPYDLLSEADLTDLSKLVNYDALVFPSFQNVAADKVGAITDTLTTLTKNYHTGIIAAGNFMTNDATGAALPGDSYARMKALLDVNLTGYASGVNVQVAAGSSTNPMMAGYTPGEVIRNYSGISTSYFTSTDGLGTTLANQIVNGQSQAAVLATKTGGNNVHFATEGMLGDNNMLQHAIDWVTAPASGPQVSLHLSRDKAVVAARVDMDQAMQIDDVKPASGPGIYDALMPILAQWKKDYNFVGSYYIDIGNNQANGEYTDWTYSKKYYNQLLAMGNEIGSHSYTHPEDTNVLTAAQYQFEFQQSRQVIEQQLGLTNIGVAVPGAGENITTSRNIAQYYPYMTGGASMIGAGYPGAIGYLSPAAADSKVYIAPNTSFDFTLIGYQKLTPAQAEAKWASEWSDLTTHSDMPVVVWPWHDYGPTNWPLDPGVASNYTQQMFTDFIQRAYQAGSEFVTLGDLAQRVSTLEKSDVSTSWNAATSVLTATVTTATTGDLGKFALDLGAGQTIKNVGGWYAYDKDSVFADRDGGTFNIALGGTPDDVTHLSKLADRSDLVSVTGDGTNLSFTAVGEGKFQVTLKSPQNQFVQVTGADSASLSGNLLDLNVSGLGQHTIAVNEVSAPTMTAARDLIFGTAAANTINGLGGDDFIDGGAGADTLTGGAGNDTFAFSAALVTGNADHITDFSPSATGNNDTIQLSSSVFNIPTGTLASTAFKSMSSTNPASVTNAAENPATRILYNKALGTLYYDADGSQAGSNPTLFATLDNKPTLTASDFAIV
ncbi:MULTISPECIES: polysaccharide deacetylase family protein [Methylobacterium]|uniref:polysaccharide deacetylase family protein n=1 Tax=Methylobacterium TaxID=407 RepID=UPI0013EDCECA|nr:polysaccharide deacetylase family protein [Methylobacterium sp. DB0501]NGM34040.1 polysaccharide deacetylase family protein [Methylobacterium sp. DB0501]